MRLATESGAQSTIRLRTSAAENAIHYEVWSRTFESQQETGKSRVDPIIQASLSGCPKSIFGTILAIVGFSGSVPEAGFNVVGNSPQATGTGSRTVWRTVAIRRFVRSAASAMSANEKQRRRTFLRMDCCSKNLSENWLESYVLHQTQARVLHESVVGARSERLPK